MAGSLIALGIAAGLSGIGAKVKGIADTGKLPWEDPLGTITRTGIGMGTGLVTGGLGQGIGALASSVLGPTVGAGASAAAPGAEAAAAPIADAAAQGAGAPLLSAAGPVPGDLTLQGVMQGVTEGSTSGAQGGGIVGQALGGSEAAVQGASIGSSRGAVAGVETATKLAETGATPDTISAAVQPASLAAGADAAATQLGIGQPPLMSAIGPEPGAGLGLEGLGQDPPMLGAAFGPEMPTSAWDTLAGYARTGLQGADKLNKAYGLARQVQGMAEGPPRPPLAPPPIRTRPIRQASVVPPMVVPPPVGVPFRPLGRL